MKRIEKLAIALVIAWIIQAITLPAIFTVLPKQIISNPNISTYLLSYGAMLLRSAVALLCGVWLFYEAKEEQQNKWIWCFFGLVFQLNAVMIFYAYVIVHLLKAKRIESSEQWRSG